MIEKFNKWKRLNENDLIEIKKTYSDIKDVSTLCAIIVGSEKESFLTFDEKLRVFFKEKGVDDQYRAEKFSLGEKLTFEKTISFRYFNRENEDFDERHSKHFRPEDWKGVTVFDNKQEAVNSIKKLLDEASSKFKIDIKILSMDYGREGAVIPSLKVTVSIFKETIFEKIAKLYLESTKTTRTSRYYGL
jgi:hypothetical protein